MSNKNIVLLSDGTGNSSAKVLKTNVWRLYQTLDLANPETQIAYYDDGVGTSSFKPLAIVAGIFGFGLKRNVIDIYSFCCRNYARGDRIYGFGFSRGAFTIRVVAGFIARIGLIRYDGNDEHLARDAETAYRQYRKARNFRSGGNLLIGPLRSIRDWVSHVIFRKPSVAIRLTSRATGPESKSLEGFDRVSTTGSVCSCVGDAHGNCSHRLNSRCRHRSKVIAQQTIMPCAPHQPPFRLQLVAHAINGLLRGLAAR